MRTVSVHIVTFNSGQDIRSCLESVIKQEYPIRSIIVIDNASRDTTCDVLEEYKERITLIRNTVNLGFAAAHNQAIHLSETDYCLILNPDVTLRQDYLSKLMSYVENRQDTRLGSLTGKLLLKSTTDMVDSCGLSINKARRAVDLGAGENQRFWKESCPVFGVSGAAALYSIKMIRNISFGGDFFDNCFFAYKEDVDVAWRAQLFGWEAAFIPDAIAFHERGWKAGNRGKQPLFVRKLSYINRYKMMLKNDRLFWVFRHLGPLLLYECLSLGYILLREPFLLSAWFSFIRDWKKLRAWRRFIQSNSSGNSKKIYSFFKP